MLESLRAKAVPQCSRTGDGKDGRISSVYRSGDGREGRLGGVPPSVPPGRSKGEGGQAIAWQTMNFTKLDSAKDGNNGSSSTSPETDPGTSNVFPYFKDYDEGMQEREGDAQDEGDHAAPGMEQQQGAGEGGLGLSRKISDKFLEKKTTTGSKQPQAVAKLDFRNPLFHSANGHAEEAIASVYLREEREDPSRSTINGSNPMFKRSVSLQSRPRPKVNPDIQRASSTVSASGGTAGEAVRHVKGDKGEHHRSKKKKDKTKKAMYEHVGRMNVRPFVVKDGDDAEGVGHGGFRVDTFARNEGEAGEKAHFKFVFTLDGVEVPSEGPDARRLRPVVDAKHERATGGLRVHVNDGREIKAEDSSVVNIPLANVGTVIFYPKTMSKGHHLYTLSLNGRTLFSVLA